MDPLDTRAGKAGKIGAALMIPFGLLGVLAFIGGDHGMLTFYVVAVLVIAAGTLLSLIVIAMVHSEKPLSVGVSPEGWGMDGSLITEAEAGTSLSDEAFITDLFTHIPDFRRSGEDA